MALHEQSVGATDEWYTPSHVFRALGCEFEMDVASPGPGYTPWIPAKKFVTKASYGSGLEIEWDGFVWMNAPFGARNGLVPWLAKFFDHGNGIALVPDRTSAPWWQVYAPQADLVLFCTPKIKFIGADGKPRRFASAGNMSTCCWRARAASAFERRRSGARNAVRAKSFPNLGSANTLTNTN